MRRNLTLVAQPLVEWPQSGVPILDALKDLISVLQPLAETLNAMGTRVQERIQRLTSYAQGEAGLLSVFSDQRAAFAAAHGVAATVALVDIVMRSCLPIRQRRPLHAAISLGRRGRSEIRIDERRPVTPRRRLRHSNVDELGVMREVADRIVNPGRN